MPYRIRQGLSYCLCEGRPIFLDIDTGRYATLPEPLCAPFTAVISDEGHVGLDQIERLLGLRVIEPGTNQPGATKCIDAPAREIAATPQHVWPIAAALAQGLATHRMRHMPLRRLFAVEAARHASNRAAEEAELGRLRGAFDRVAAVFGEADACLPRSLAFRRLALRLGHTPSLVIGVKIDPFGAHCWVQTGARVDNDSLERVRLFTPIHIL